MMHCEVGFCELHFKQKSSLFLFEAILCLKRLDMQLGNAVFLDVLCM